MLTAIEDGVVAAVAPALLEREDAVATLVVVGTSFAHGRVLTVGESVTRATAVCRTRKHGGERMRRHNGQMLTDLPTNVSI